MSFASGSDLQFAKQASRPVAAQNVESEIRRRCVMVSHPSFDLFGACGRRQILQPAGVQNQSPEGSLGQCFSWLRSSVRVASVQTSSRSSLLFGKHWAQHSVVSLDIQDGRALYLETWPALGCAIRR